MDTRKIVGLAALIVLATGGTALATGTAIRGSVIHACAKRGTGELRIAQKCRLNERPMSWNQQASGVLTGSQGYATVASNKSLAQEASHAVIAMTRSPNGDYYCFDLTFTPLNVVVSAGLGGSYIVGDVVGARTITKDSATALCGTSAVDALVYFPSGESGFYASFR